MTSFLLVFSPENDHPIFRRLMCTSPSTFFEIVKRLKDDPSFHNNSNNPQAPAKQQIACAMFRFGHYGNAASIEDTATLAGVSTGSIVNYTEQVMIAILNRHDLYIKFPQDGDADKKKAKEWVRSRTTRAWEGGWLCADGSGFNLYQKPGLHGEGYFDRKSRYSISCQVSSFFTFLSLS
ncbi:hypothetical protein SERLA73DRAFT_57521 [Serpula lacrymans var. lacrymans S7.3]|uniref:DDE Tnp4 domain-containing protein n=1 Tax=Serpula lacrymans var. lacrymans (strain S7.3) TaxID=936435 RepID=F8Q3J8_SERL3|nr:hypothetical protein SERLA73DRAFT_57521 [Serpula lacrymans var. lacrymans S7.3]